MKKRTKISIIVVGVFCILCGILFFAFMKNENTENAKQAETSIDNPVQQEKTSETQKTNSTDIDISGKQNIEENIENNDDKEVTQQSENKFDNEATIPEDWGE